MEPKDEKRLMRYILLLLIVIGGMVYLSQLGKETGNDSEKPVEQEAGGAPAEAEVSEVEEVEEVEEGEISLVMGHEAINWLERDNREDEEAPSKAVKGLELRVDAVVADIGSGSGYYTFLIAPLVPEGKVIGVDIQPEMVAFLGQKAAKLGVANVEAHLGKVDSVQLPEGTVDAVILVDAYHEFSHPNEMMQSIFHALKPGGRVYLLEYRGEDPDVPIKTLHKMTEAQSVKEMKVVGLRHLRTEGFLPWQHFMIFEK
jgi:ubiquinone/menaquinone biosynthesis C-methylase UbiE